MSNVDQNQRETMNTLLMTCNKLIKKELEATGKMVGEDLQFTLQIFPRGVQAGDASCFMSSVSLDECLFNIHTLLRQLDDNNVDLELPKEH